MSVAILTERARTRFAAFLCAPSLTTPQRIEVDREEFCEVRNAISDGTAADGFYPLFSQLSSTGIPEVFRRKNKAKSRIRKKKQ